MDGRRKIGCGTRSGATAPDPGSPTHCCAALVVGCLAFIAAIVSLIVARAPSMTRPEDWLQIRPAGLYCVPGDFHIDPIESVDRAVVTHGHGDHARPGHRRVLATPGTLAIMAA